MKHYVLRYRKFWLVLGWAGLGLLVYLSLTPRPHHLLTFSFGDKIEHIAAFATVTFWFGQLYASATARAWLALLLMVTSIFLEIGQWRIGGYASLEYDDVAASVVGIGLGLILLGTATGGMLLQIERWLRVED